MSQKPISCKPFLDLSTLHIPYVTNTPANRCHGKVNYVFKQPSSMFVKLVKQKDVTHIKVVFKVVFPCDSIDDRYYSKVTNHR